MIELIYCLGVILLVFFFPVVGVPVLIFKKKEWWGKMWVKVVCIGWLIFFCAGVANSTTRKDPPQASEAILEQPNQNGDINDADSAKDDDHSSKDSSSAEESAKQDEGKNLQPSQQGRSDASSSSSPNSGVDYIVSGYCNDGTPVSGNPSAKGKANACYGHKGWRDY